MSEAPDASRTRALTLPSPATIELAPVSAVVTRMHIAATPREVWDGLMFYEQIERKPPWHLRLLLPVPIRTEGRKSEVGDEATCLYVGGHLIKRVTGVEPEARYQFSVMVQELEVGGGIRLSGGAYELRELDDGTTEISVTTRYTATRRPRWLWRRVEATVCHVFHRHILRAMRQAIEGR